MEEREQLLSQWLEVYGDLIKRTCCLCLGDEALAEDATQDTFLRAWRSMAQYEGRNNASVRTWLVSIAMNVCRNYRRTSWMRRLDRRITPEELPQPARAEDGELLILVRSLPDSLRDAVVLRYYHGMSLEEMAKALGISRSACHHRLHKALKRLRIDLRGGAEDD